MIIIILIDILPDWLQLYFPQELMLSDYAVNLVVELLKKGCSSLENC